MPPDSTTASPARRVAYFVMRYPLLTQSFLDREMRGVQAAGLEVEVHPLWDFGNASEPAPGGPRVVRLKFFATLLAALAEALRRPGLVVRGLRALLRHRPTFAEGWFMGIWGGLCALAKADYFRRAAPCWLHGAWATAPATTALGLSALLGRPFSFGAHAYDLHRHGGDPLLPLKLRRARFVHTTTQMNVEDLRRRFPEAPAEIVLARRGLSTLPPPRPTEDDDWSARTVQLLSVARLVPKKGHRFQFELMRELHRRGLRARLVILGDGPLKRPLRQEAHLDGLDIHLPGAAGPAEVAEAYRLADIFLHTGIVDEEGDRDGLPNVVPEAMAAGALVISSPGGGAAEAIAHEQTGLIADPHDPAVLADAVQRLRDDPALRARLRPAARAWVEREFLAAANARLLAQRMH
ncbi:MAG: glycosyltransferase family 4 protein [Verrucomicrobia bacterium]|nr:glycosyltransferase family 4 protein [Verrucomicrobiota bacterium]